MSTPRWVCCPACHHDAFHCRVDTDGVLHVLCASCGQVLVSAKAPVAEAPEIQLGPF